MIFLAVCGYFFRNLQYSIVALMTLSCCLKQTQKEKHKHQNQSTSLFFWLTFCVIAIHPIIHANTMYTPGFYQTNIAYDLSLHTFTAILSFMYIILIHQPKEEGKKGKPTLTQTQIQEIYLFLNIIGCFFATYNAIRIQKPDSSETGEHTTPWITIFPTLSVIHFSVLNIFQENTLFQKRMLLEFLFTIAFFMILVYKLLPVSIFMAMQYAENYFTCAWWVACMYVKNK